MALPRGLLEVKEEAKALQLAPMVPEGPRSILALYRSGKGGGDMLQKLSCIINTSFSVYYYESKIL